MRRIPDRVYIHAFQSHLIGPATLNRFDLIGRPRKRQRLVGRAAVVFSLWAVPSVLAEAYRLGVWNIERFSPSATRGFPELTGANALPLALLPTGLDRKLRPLAPHGETYFCVQLIITEFPKAVVVVWLEALYPAREKGLQDDTVISR
jgi:hypothetical protein